MLTLFIAGTDVVLAQHVVRVQLNGEKLTGQIVAHNNRECWLVAPDGRLHGLNVASVQQYEPLGQRLGVDNAISVRAKLQKELGSGYTVLSSGRYVVAAPPRTAKQHLATIDEIGRTFTAYFSKRGIPLESPRFPLVAIIFGTEEEFGRYAENEGVTATRGLAGYYLRSSNRIAAFDTAVDIASAGRDGNVDVLQWPLVTPDVQLPVKSTSAASVRDTLIHEATHQMAFNTGLHHRAGKDPKWVVEGLATLFEPDAVRKNVSSSEVASRINQERLRWYRERLEPNWTGATLTDLITSDRPFETDVLNAYALSWALTFYLNESHARNYARYLRVLKERDPLAEYSADDRLNDFRTVFGRDLRRFEVDLIRFLERLP